MCGHWKRKSFHTAKSDDLISLLSYGAALGLETVCYSGGDPFAYPRGMLKRIMRWHRKNHVSYGFITGGYLRKKFREDKELLYLLSEADFIRVSLDAVDPDIYSKVRGGVKVEGVLDSINLLSDRDCNLGLGITVQKDNQYNIGDIMEFAYQTKNIKEVRCWIVRENPDKVPDDVSYLSAVLGNWHRAFKTSDISDNLDSAKNDLIVGEGEGLPFNSCYACLYQLFIDSSGEVFPCCIIAGDTESRDHGVSFGNIYTHNQLNNANLWDMVWSRVLKYNRRQLEQLPEICRNNCITRLRTINCYAQKEWDKKHFL
jgi:MoaA/NifB/PqqE/SkfB family radical SAM enzyme